MFSCFSGGQAAAEYASRPCRSLGVRVVSELRLRDVRARAAFAMGYRYREMRLVMIEIGKTEGPQNRTRPDLADQEKEPST